MKDNEIEVCEPDSIKLKDSSLEAVSGGKDANSAAVYKKRFEYETAVNMKIINAEKYLHACDCEFIKPIQYPCPVCGSRNVVNADPGVFRKMRVLCYDCGAFKDRSGGDPWGIGE